MSLSRGVARNGVSTLSILWGEYSTALPWVAIDQPLVDQLPMLPTRRAWEVDYLLNSMDPRNMQHVIVLLSFTPEWCHCIALRRLQKWIFSFNRSGPGWGLPYVQFLDRNRNYKASHRVSVDGKPLKRDECSASVSTKIIATVAKWFERQTILAPTFPSRALHLLSRPSRRPKMVHHVLGQTNQCRCAIKQNIKRFHLHEQGTRKTWLQLESYKEGVPRHS